MVTAADVCGERFMMSPQAGRPKAPTPFHPDLFKALPIWQAISIPPRVYLDLHLPETTEQNSAGLAKASDKAEPIRVAVNFAHRKNKQRC